MKWPPRPTALLHSVRLLLAGPAKQGETSMPGFDETFAIFLRHNREIWRVRRIDKFEPVEVVLARQHTTLQGMVNRDLIDAFARAHGGRRGVQIPDDLHRFMAYIPALSLPKRLLLDFDVRDENGRSLPMLSRAEGCQWTALDLLALLIQWKDDDFAELENLGRAPNLQALLATMVAVNPHRLAERQRSWAPDGDTYQLGRGFEPDALQDWIKSEAEEFLPGSGGEVVAALQPELLRQSSGTCRTIDERARPDGLAYFPTYSSLVANAVQDLMKAIIQAADPWPTRDDESDPPRRVALMQEPGSLAHKVAEVIADMPLLERLLASQRRFGPEAELLRYLDRWTAYVPTEIRVGVPFVLKFTQMLPLGRPLSSMRRMEKWALLRNTYHEYPLARQDAAAVHVEIAIPDPELRIAGNAEIFEETGKERSPVTVVFGHEIRPTGRLLHRYSSRRPERSDSNVTPEDIARHLYCRVKLELVRSVKWGYSGTFAGFALAAIYVAYVLIQAVVTQTPLEDPVLPATAGVLAITLSVWLSTVQNKGAIVYRKLWPARRVFYFALVFIIIPAVIYMANRVICDLA